MLRVHILFFFPLNNKLMLGFKKIRVIGVNLGEILIKGKRNLFQLAGNSSNLSLSHRGSTVTAVMQLQKENLTNSNLLGLISWPL